MTCPPHTLQVVAAGICDKLKGWNQWVAWGWEMRDGRWTKVPINPATGRYASSTDPETWTSFRVALERAAQDGLPGVGFVFGLRDPFAGADLDDCRDPATGRLEPWATEIIEGLDSYAEISPSGTGVKVFIRGEKPPGRKRKGNIEIYDRGRFFTTTGHRLPWVPVSAQDRQGELSALHYRIFGEPASRVAGSESDAASTRSAHGIGDVELIDRAIKAANGEKFARLWAGDTSGYASGDNEGRSEADLALCSLLAFWCGPDQARIDALFRQSGLYREKWERADYRALTLAVALDREEFWSGDEAPTLQLGKVYARRRGVVSVG